MTTSKPWLKQAEAITEQYGVPLNVLIEFAERIISSSKAVRSPSKKKQSRGLGLSQLKMAVLKHFEAETITQMKQRSAYKLGTNGLKLNLSKTESWEILYRKFIGILPGEEQEEGSDCINGINIFKYNYPWKAFGLDSKLATLDDVKSTYRNLSKIYHPDAGITGNRAVFERLTQFYNSLLSVFES
jgi:hypothetical protein